MARESKAGRSSPAVVLISGGFDPIHIGHIRLILAAGEYGGVVVALNSDSWLKRKKGYAFMPWKDRAEILRAVRCVRRVLRFDDADGTVCAALRSVKPNFFANGGDRVTANGKESEVCEELGIAQLFGVGGDKVQSSQALFK